MAETVWGFVLGDPDPREFPDGERLGYQTWPSREQALMAKLGTNLSYAAKAPALLTADDRRHLAELSEALNG